MQTARSKPKNSKSETLTHYCRSMMHDETKIWRSTVTTNKTNFTMSSSVPKIGILPIESKSSRSGRHNLQTEAKYTLKSTKLLQIGLKSLNCTHIEVEERCSKA